MKAHIYFGRGKWWCYRMGCTGCGATPKEAWDDMWALYREAVRFAMPIDYSLGPRYA